MNEFIELVQSILPEGWSIEDESMGMDLLLICPHDAVIEADGRCPEGCVSPLVKAGLA